MTLSDAPGSLEADKGSGEPRLRRPALLVVLLLLMTAAVQGTAPVEAATSVTSSFSVSGEPGEYISGRSEHRDDATSVFRVFRASRTSVSLYLTDRANRIDDWSIDLAAPDGLWPGRFYPNAWPWGDPQGRPGIMVSAHYRGCSGYGQFEVRDIGFSTTGVLTRLWTVFEYRCEGGNKSLMGEVRYRMPTAAGVRLTPSVASWPEVPVGQLELERTTQLRNPGPSAVTVQRASIVGADAAAFPIAQDGCTGKQLAVGAACTVRLRFVPIRKGPHHATLAASFSDGSRRYVQLDGSGRPGRTRMTIQADPAERLTGGGQWTLQPPEQPVDFLSYQVQESAVRTTSMLPDGRRITVVLDPGGGNRFVAGTTLTTVRWPSPYPYDKPGISVFVDDYEGCYEAKGSITVRAVHYHPADGRLHRFDGDFVHRCDGRPEAIRGRIELGSGEATPPSKVSGLTATRSGDRVTFRWTNPSSADWSRNTIRLQPGTSAPAAPLTGKALYAGRAGELTVTLAATRAWSVSVWSTDTNGNTSAARSLSLPRSS